MAVLKKSLLTILRNKLIPWVQQDGVSRMVLAEWPLSVPPGVQLTPYPLPPFPDHRRGRSYFSTDRWGEAGMKALRYPYFGFMIEGEADHRIGVTRSQLARLKKEQPHEWQRLDRKNGCKVLSLPARTMLVIPPGVPHDSTGAHWWREAPERANSHIFWLLALPAGAVVHTCFTRGLEHPTQPCPFVPDAQVHMLAEFLVEALRERSNGYEIAAQGYLLSILSRTARALEKSPLLIHNQDRHTFMLEDEREGFEGSMAHTALRRAQRYIEMHLDSDLSPDVIARYAFVSPTHMNRIFRQELNVSVMEHVTQCRLRAAQSLLIDTNEPVQEIGKTVGFRRPPHFSRVFSAHCGVSPMEFRKQHRQPETNLTR